MHEFSLCRQIIKIVETFIIDIPFDDILTVHVEIGDLVAVEKSALLFAFEVMKKGTKMQSAKLDIIEISGQGVCQVCDKSFKMKQYFQYCSECEHSLLTVTQGEELRVIKIEVK